MNITKNLPQSKSLFFLILTILFSSLVLTSCSSSKIKLNKKELDQVNLNQGFYFDNYPYMTQQTNYRFPSLLDAFQIYDTPKDRIYIDFLNENELRVSYQNERGKLISHTFEGQLKDNYFEIYFKRLNTGLPPFFWATEIDRLQIAYNEEGNLLLNHKYKNGKYYFFGLLFQKYTDDLMIDRDVSKNRQQLFFKQKKILPEDVEYDFRLFL